MKFARLPAASLPLLLCLSYGCSDPPSAPAQAAITLSIGPASGETCTHNTGQLSMPSSQNTGVLDELSCDLMAGCKPDQYLVVDRDRGANISCTVSPTGGNFNVQLSLNVDGSAVGQPSLNFGLNGVLSPTGGMASISESNTNAKGGGNQDDCTVTVTPNFGVLKKGSVWASFECPAFRDPTNIGDTGCDVTGIFLFENCGG